MPVIASWGAGMHGRTMAIRHALLSQCLWTCLFGHDLCAQPANFQVNPSTIVLDTPEATQQILARSPTADLTRSAAFEALDPKIAAVDSTGMVRAVAEGRTVVVVRFGQDQVRIPVEVSGLKSPAPVSFETQVMPILTRAGCNAGACHGKAEGKNGFKLSVFGFDPVADHEALVMEGRGRRVFPAAPASSLMLLKAAGQIAHGGGKRLVVDSLHYRRLYRWIAEGARFSIGAPAVTAIEVEPQQQI